MVALKKTVQKFELPDPASPFAADVLKGLRSTPKRIPPKYFYDRAGCALFERITDLPEYYLTRSELRILEDNAAAIAKLYSVGLGAGGIWQRLEPQDTHSARRSTAACGICAGGYLRRDAGG